MNIATNILKNTKPHETYIISEKMNTLRRLLEFCLKVEIFYNEGNVSGKECINKQKSNLKDSQISSLLNILGKDTLADKDKFKEIERKIHNYSHDNGMQIVMIEVMDIISHMNEYVEILDKQFQEYTSKFQIFTPIK